jgi:hypothetical protein
MEESFTNRGNGPDSMATVSGRRSSATRWVGGDRKVSLGHAVTGTRHGARYALATMLLARPVASPVGED